MALLVIELVRAFEDADRRLRPNGVAYDRKPKSTLSPFVQVVERGQAIFVRAIEL